MPDDKNLWLDSGVLKFPSGRKSRRKKFNARNLFNDDRCSPKYSEFRGLKSIGTGFEGTSKVESHPIDEQWWKEKTADARRGPRFENSTIISIVKLDVKPITCASW